MSEEVVRSIWQRRVGWSRAADRLKARVTYARRAALVLSSLGAISGTVAATLLTDHPSWRTGCAALGAVLLAVATYVTTKFLTVDAVRAWTRARSVSEAIKGEVYTFRASARPYDGPDAMRVLQSEVSKVDKEARDLERYVAAVTVAPSSAPDQHLPRKITSKPASGSKLKRTTGRMRVFTHAV